ncbi:MULTISPECIES: hypothetical protein [unclassified Bradyrhizobium]|uniref:hypothetical protein n=1 Tax=unclassified Bradyrhizobium TaxID=2631580 RepID=UPI0020B21E90|nr:MULTISPECIES: hypothetical protein [unclassified Bradyrhizobium]MCP3402870.1 hypothetical protein [Bradyrhizobium sp. CCGB20]MCP3411348.1 hypothetical protein [Bradyrhizobium sp. CCGB01]
MKVDLNDKIFRGRENYDVGDFDETVIFTFSQRKAIVTATFEGQLIEYGVLLGAMTEDGTLSGHWIYLNRQQQPFLGVFESTVELSSAGRIVLKEHWASLSPGAPRLGFSTIEEA